MNKTSTLPNSYQDFTKPEFKDKIVLTYPNDDDAIMYQFELMYDHLPILGKQVDLQTSTAYKSSAKNGSTPY
jgi:ABC-type Fe3+ transport system substrate-binding protein